MDPNEFFAKVDKARYASSLDRGVSRTVEATVEALEGLLGLVVQLHEASESYWPDSSEAISPGGKNGTHPEVRTIRDSKLDEFMRTRVSAGLRRVQEECDKTGREIIGVLRGGTTIRKLSEVEKAQVKHRFERGQSPTKIARDYGISRSQVYRIGKGGSD